MRASCCLLSVLFLLTAAFHAFPADRLFESFSSDLPASVRSAFFCDLRKIRILPLSCAVSDAAEAESALFFRGEKALSGGGIDPAFSTAAFFFSGDSAGLLMDSSLSPEQLTSFRTEEGTAPAFTFTEIRNGFPCPVFLLNAPAEKVPENADDVFACGFPGRPGRLLISTASGLLPLLRAEKGLSPESRACLELLPPGALAEGILAPDHSRGSGEDPSVLWKGVGRIAFAFFWEEKETYPFRGRVLFFPRTPSEAGAVQRNVEELVRSAYAAGREKGEIRPEMLFAFQVLPGRGCTELRIQLTAPDAEDFAALFAAQLKKGVSGR